MANAKKPNGNAGGTIGVVVGLVSAATPIVLSLLDKIPPSPKPKNDKTSIFVPELHAKGFPLTWEQAKVILASKGLGIMPTELALHEAKIEYKDCVDGQVVASLPESKEKAESGQMIIVRYVTQEVIEQSKRMFEEEQRKAEQISKKKKTNTTKIQQTIVHVGNNIKRLTNRSRP